MTQNKTKPEQSKPAESLVSHKEDPMLTLTEAGQLIGKSRQTISNWVRDGLLTAVRDPSGLFRIRKSQLDSLYGASGLKDFEEQRKERDRLAMERFHERQEITSPKPKEEID